MNNFGKNLRYLRVSKKLKQEEMEEPFGIKPQTWSNYENGKTQPALEFIISVSKFFGVNLDDLILGDLEGTPPSPSKTAKPYQQMQSDTVQEESVQYLVTVVKKLREDLDELIQSGGVKTERQ